MTETSRLRRGGGRQATREPEDGRRKMQEADAEEGRVMQEVDADQRQVTVVDAEDGLRMSLQPQSPEDAAMPMMVRGPGQTTPQSR